MTPDTPPPPPNIIIVQPDGSERQYIVSPDGRRLDPAIIQAPPQPRSRYAPYYDRRTGLVVFPGDDEEDPR